MSQEKTSQYDMPWHVYASLDGKTAFHSGHPTQTMAAMIAGNLADYAKKIDLRTKYTVTQKPLEET